MSPHPDVVQIGEMMRRHGDELTELATRLIDPRAVGLAERLGARAEDAGRQFMEHAGGAPGPGGEGKVLAGLRATPVDIVPPRLLVSGYIRQCNHCETEVEMDHPGPGYCPECGLNLDSSPANL